MDPRGGAKFSDYRQSDERTSSNPAPEVDFKVTHVGPYRATMQKEFKMPTGISFIIIS
jgi:hypothetical protein